MVDIESEQSNQKGIINNPILDTHYIDEDDEYDIEIIPAPESNKECKKYTEINKQCFTYNTKCHPSIMAFSKHSAALKEWFSTVFGIDGINIKKGMEVTEDEANNFIRYILVKNVGKEVKVISEITAVELGKPYLKIQYPQDLHKVLNISIQSILSLAGNIKNGWLTDEIFELWHDSLNLINGYEKEVKDYFPDKFVMGGLPFSSLYQCASIKDFFSKETIDLESTEFASELKSKILRGIFASPLGDLLQDYKKIINLYVTSTAISTQIRLISLS